MADRLRQARIDAGYRTATDFAAAHELSEFTYRSHENGTRGIKHHVAQRYAALLKIPLHWLVEGKPSDSSDDYFGPGEIDRIYQISSRALRSLFRMLRTNSYREDIAPDDLAEEAAKQIQFLASLDTADPADEIVAASAGMAINALQHITRDRLREEEAQDGEAGGSDADNAEDPA